MSPPGGVSGELWPYVGEHEAGLIDSVGERLVEERAAPPPRFRAELRARLAARANTPGETGPRRLGLAVAANVGTGFFFLAVAALGLAGVGPFAS
jgi:hypothetical protein